MFSRTRRPLPRRVRRIIRDVAVFRCLDCDPAEAELATHIARLDLEIEGLLVWRDGGDVLEWAQRLLSNMCRAPSMCPDEALR